MVEIPCPGCGEVLAVPNELADGPVRCGACHRIIQPTERDRPAPKNRSQDRDDRRDSDRSRDDNRDSRGRFDDEDRPRPSRRSARDDDDFDRPKKKSGCGIWIWIIGISGVLILGCCGCGGFFVYKASDPKWEKFSPPDGRWSAEFPGEPKMEVQPAKGVGGVASTHYAAQRLLGQEAYLVGSADSGVVQKLNPLHDAMLTAGLDAVAKEPTTTREVSRRSLKMAGVDAKEGVFDITDPKFGQGRAVVRILIVDDRVYTLVAIKAGKQGQNPEHAERFFNSFQPTVKK